MQIIAATDFSTRSNRALRQAGLLAQSSGARVAIVHVVDDDRPESLLDLEKREAERIISEQIGAMRELQGVDCRAVVSKGSAFRGILQTAETLAADLIVMGTHRRSILRDIFVGTTVERVVRTGPFPVLMVNNEAQRRYENVMATIDMSAASANALRKARRVGLLAGVRTTLLHAFFPMARGKLFIAGADNESMQQYVTDERKRANDELAAFLVANSIEASGWKMTLEEGAPIEAISRAVKLLSPDLLIMGTHGKSNFLKILIGSVAEEAMRTLDVDILAVPPAKE